MSIVTRVASLESFLPRSSYPMGWIAWAWIIWSIAITLVSFWGRRATVKAPVVGHRGVFEPTWLLRLRFIRGSRSILQNGYDEFKDSIFKIRKLGTDILMLPSERIEELRSITHDKESSVEPFMHDFAGELTSGMAFLNSDLQNRVLQQKLVPALGLITRIMKTELDSAILKEMPACEDWAEVAITPILTSIVARISARVFLGEDGPHNHEWLTTTAQYTENLFKTGMLLRMVPTIIRPPVAHLLKPYRQLRRNRKAAHRIIGSIVQSRRAAETEQGVRYEKPTDILQWMTDMAVGKETDPADLAQRMLILSLSSIHTTALTMTQALYDLIAFPQFIAPIEAEVTQALQQNHGWNKATLNQFRKLDSLLKESQRFNPIFLITFNRILHQQVIFSDNTILYPGTRIAVPAYSMLHDQKKVPGPTSPSKFDPFRYSRLREDPTHPENAQKYQFAMVDTHNMAFGFGKHACPGRAYASDEIKMILARMLLDYEWAFPNGQERPKNFTVDTDMYPDRSAKVLVRKRRASKENPISM
ncbi:Ent-kaurene oxidase [Ampelomyces quisqualis]|uniref:Ent-kaurene oxidase n=1 Tax=Ampelomyces quisqualis TaxID=50730 RepID=A0A6A5R263_AMPQU|nr:Ent-kaurene oxidase [Ampelomyces quisqualis]